MMYRLGVFGFFCGVLFLGVVMVWRLSIFFVRWMVGSCFFVCCLYCYFFFVDIFRFCFFGVGVCVIGFFGRLRFFLEIIGLVFFIV